MQRFDTKNVEQRPSLKNWHEWNIWASLGWWL